MKSAVLQSRAGTQTYSDRLAFLDSYRLMAIIMVIGIHAFAYVNLEVGSKKILSFIVRSIAVQIFFLVDGFLFARRLSSEAHFDYRRYVHQSGRRLLLPWLIFSIAYTALRFFFLKT